MTTSTSEPGRASARSTLITRALEIGFDGAAIASPDAIEHVPSRLREFLARGYEGDMGWLADKADRRADPSVLWPEVGSVLMVGLNYGPDRDPLEQLEEKDRGAISVYARNRDYHDVIKKRLKQLGRWLAEEHGAQVRVFVDTAPVAEKPLAEAAGLGWQGKHTNLVSRRWGSWLFLGALYTDLALEADEAESDHCGSCHACLDICPTRAFPAPYQLDARRCISYLTIEHKGHIAEEFRKPMGNRIYGCDDCLAVCPWNRFARHTGEAAFYARAELSAPRLVELARLDDSGFRELFSGSPIKRIGRHRFVRNVLIALGNSGAAKAIPVVRSLLDDASPLVRAMAVWGLAQLDRGAFEAARAELAGNEADADVMKEWNSA